MSFARKTGLGASFSVGQATAALWLGWTVLLVSYAQAEAPSRAQRVSVADRKPTPGQTRSGTDHTPPTVIDVALRADGLLEGTVISLDRNSHPWDVVGLPVTLWQEQQRVDTAKTSLAGKFTSRPPGGGVYRLVVETPYGARSWFYRVWTRSAAPPHAQTSMNLPISKSLLRGQSPFPIMNFRHAATVTAIAAGALGAPIIYNKVKKDGYIPAVPVSP